ncbi:MAG: 50S ribosomal protein L29 [Actinobacteria bacterium]|nr:50S ribosomal protein L29 [Actinomycetota bacterium]
MKVDELKELTDEELSQKLLEAKRNLFNLRFQLATGQLDNFARIKAAKKDIARVYTVKKQKELSAGNQV